jgi:hypothetical protein
MKRWIALALLACATLAHAQSSPAKKELVAKLLQLQQPGIENLGRAIVERPAMQLMQAAGNALRTQVPPEKREAAAKSIEADVRQFVDESTPVMRERAVKLAQTTVGPLFEEKFNEDELKQLVAWMESPVNKKYQQLGAEMENGLTQKLLGEAGPLLDPKLQALQQKVRATLGTSAGAAPAAKPAASAAKVAASGAKPAAKAASK